MARARIVSDPKIMHGQPVVAGTRIPVELILDHLAEGYSGEDIIVEYPQLTKSDIRAAIRYASRLVAQNATRKAK